MAKINPVELKSTTTLIAPLIVIFIAFYLFVSLYSAAAGQLAIRECCLDLGLPANCSDGRALNAASSVSLISVVIAGIIALVTIGFYGAISNRLGRRKIVAVSIIGTVCQTLPWFLITHFPQIFHSHWKIVVVLGEVFNVLAGGSLAATIGAYGQLQDITSKNQRIRVIIFIVVDIISGVAGIIGVQGAALLLKYDPILLTTISSSGCLGLLLFTIFFMYETVDEKVRNQPIDWKKANTIGQLSFFLPTKSNLKVLDDDFKQICDKLTTIYHKQLNEGEEEEKKKEEERSLVKIDDIGIKTTNISHIDNNTDNNYTLPPQSFMSINKTTDKHIIRGSDEKSELLLSPESDDGTEQQHDEQQQLSQEKLNEQQQQQQVKIPKLTLSEPPRYIEPSNSMFIFALILVLGSCHFIGRTVIDLFYIKKVFNASSQDYSNLLTIDAITKAFSSFILVPLIQKFIKTPDHERKLLAFSMWSSGLACLIFPLCTSYTQYCVVLVCGGLIGGLAAGLSRSLIGNQVSLGLQGAVLASLVSYICLTVIVSGFGFNMLWILTSEYNSGIVYYVCGAVALLTGICPFLISDSCRDFNLRIEMTTQYSTITSAEKKLEAEQLEEEQKELHSEDLTIIEDKDGALYENEIDYAI